jgi:hypothetical protein
MNRRRLALSAFVVGAIAWPTVLHRWSNWEEAIRAFEMHRIGAYCTSWHHAAPQPPLPGGTDDSYFLLKYPDVCDAMGVPSVLDGFAAAGPILSPWLLAVIIGGVSAAIVGYLVPTFYVVVFRGVPSVARAYVRWLNGPDA